jgi:hypothetical protein
MTTTAPKTTDSVERKLHGLLEDNNDVDAAVAAARKSLTARER